MKENGFIKKKWWKSEFPYHQVMTAADRHYDNVGKGWHGICAHHLGIKDCFNKNVNLPVAIKYRLNFSSTWQCKCENSFNTCQGKAIKLLPNVSRFQQLHVNVNVRILLSRIVTKWKSFKLQKSAKSDKTSCFFNVTFL